MKNIKNWIIIVCLLGAAVLILFTNTSWLNKAIVIAAALFGSAILLANMKK